MCIKMMRRRGDSVSRGGHCSTGGEFHSFFIFSARVTLCWQDGGRDRNQVVTDSGQKPTAGERVVQQQTERLIEIRFSYKTARVKFNGSVGLGQFIVTPLHYCTSTLLRHNGSLQSSKLSPLSRLPNISYTNLLT